MGACFAGIRFHPTSTLSRADLEWHIEEWLLHCEGQHAASTAQTRRVFLKNFLWFLDHRGFKECGTP